jgi:multidrug efflux pump subunit AcrA (membrane-fusion protein)
MKKVIVLTIGVVFGAIVILGFARFYLEKHNTVATTVDTAIPVQVELTRAAEIQKNLEYVGNVRAEEEALVYPKVSGKLIEKIKVEGDAVQKGEILLYVDRDEVGLKFEKAPIESPMNGIVGEITVDIGEHVTPQTVVKMDRMKIALDIPEVYSSKISLGQEVLLKFDAYPAEAFQGKITKISPIINLANRAFPIEILILNPENKLKSGMFAKVEIIIESHENAITVRKEVILGKEPNAYVYIVENNIAKLRNVKIGIRSADRVEISEGVQKGDLVVVLGQQRLYDGAQVRIDTGSSQEPGP